MNGATGMTTRGAGAGHGGEDAARATVLAREDMAARGTGLPGEGVATRGAKLGVGAGATCDTSCGVTQGMEGGASSTWPGTAEGTTGSEGASARAPGDGRVPAEEWGPMAVGTMTSLVRKSKAEISGTLLVLAKGKVDLSKTTCQKLRMRL